MDGPVSSQTGRDNGPRPEERLRAAGPAGTAAGRAGAFLAGALLVAALIGALTVHLAAPVLPEDDAYITYRYARNALSGEGPVYNAGERVFGISTPLYLGWLVALGRALPAADLPELAVRSNALWFVAAALALAWLVATGTGSRPAGALAGALAAASPRMLEISLGGMEPFLFAALALGGLAAQASARPRLGALLVGLCAISRPEGLLVGLVWGVGWLARQPGRPAGRAWDWPAAALAALPLAVWCLGATLYYGTPVPHSLVAKNAPLYLISAGVAALTYLAAFSRWSVPAPLAEASAPIAILIALLTLVSALWVLLRWRGARQRALWARVALLTSFIAILYSTRGLRLFDWYLPLPWLLWLGFLLGAAATLRACARWRSAWIPTALLILLAAAPTLYDLGCWALSGERLPERTPYRTRIMAYAEAGRIARALAAPGDALMASEIGALGYAYGGYVYDTAGLVSPAALAHLPIPLEERPGPLTGAVRLGFAQAYVPAFIVAMPGYLERTLAPSPWFAEHYEQAAEVALEETMEAGGTVQIWRRTAPNTDE